MQKKKVRILAVLLCMVLGMSIISCGGQTTDNDGEMEGTVAETEGSNSTADSSAETGEQSNGTSDKDAAGEEESGQETESEVEAQVEAEVEPEEEEDEVEYFEAYDSLNELAIQHGFSMGVAMGASQMGYSAYKEMAVWHFGSISATNEMKAYSLLDQSASKKSKDGMPVMNYETADKIVAFAQENGLGVRGHVLVWDAYMCDWFFREGYSGNGAYVDQATMKARLQYYIEEVITHFEEKFPGVVYCWDVVNEAVGDGSSDYAADDPRRVRTARSGASNPFYTYVGADYVELSFLYAKNTVEKLQKKNPDVDIKLFYNDYNTFYDDKRDAICELITSINSYAQDANGNNRKLCDGVGMQSYIGGYGKQDGCMNSSDLTRVEKAIQKYADLGVEVHVTELAVRNYKDDKATLDKHGEFYGKLFQIYVNANKDGEPIVTNVSIWGIQDNPYMSTDEYSYKMNGPYCGLFDRSLCVKDSFREVYKVLSGE